MITRSSIRIIQGHGGFRRQPVELSGFPKEAADAAPVIIADDLLFRWAHIVKIAKLAPGMSAVRGLERQIQVHSCRGCQKPAVVFDRSPLENVRRFLAECPDDTARAVKEAAGIIKYRVHYRDLTGVPKEVVR
jgi:hypothetical protein